MHDLRMLLVSHEHVNVNDSFTKNEAFVFLTGHDVALEEVQQLAPLRGTTGEGLRHRGHVQAVHGQAELVLRWSAPAPAPPSGATTTAVSAHR